MTNSSPWYRWPIEIDGLPNLKMVDLSMVMLNNQMVKQMGIHGANNGEQLILIQSIWDVYLVGGLEHEFYFSIQLGIS